MRYYFPLYGLSRAEDGVSIPESSFCLLNTDGLGVILYEFIYARPFLKLVFLWNNLSCFFNNRRPTRNRCWNSFVIRIRNEFGRAERKHRAYTCSVMLFGRTEIRHARNEREMRRAAGGRTRRKGTPIEKNLFAPKVYRRKDFPVNCKSGILFAVLL
jgi:hypothetical protein